MNNLVNYQRAKRFGLYDHKIDEINYQDYHLKTPMGIYVPSFIKRFKLNQFHFFGIIGPEVMAGMAAGGDLVSLVRHERSQP